jgi:hypothetical protein
LAVIDQQQLFGVRLGVPVLCVEIAVPEGEDGQADFFKVAAAKIGDVPAQHVLNQLDFLRGQGFPVFGRIKSERRQRVARLFHHVDRIGDDPV